MRTQKVLSLTVGLFSIALLAGCGGPAPTNSNSSSSNVVKANSNNPLETTKITPEELKNDAPTLTPVFKAYCEAWSKNDEAGIRKSYSQDTLKFFEANMKLEKIKSLMKYLEEDKVSGSLCEVVNEKVEGERAVARVRTEKYPNGIRVVFVKEGGEWKMTTQSPDLNLKKATNANSDQ